MGQPARRRRVVLGPDADADALLGRRDVAFPVGRVEADDRLGVADVNDEEHASTPFRACVTVPAVVQSRSSPRSSTGAEWVSAPTEIRSGPAAA